MAIAMSLGNRFLNTKAWRRVVTSKEVTTSVEIAVKIKAKVLVTQFVTSFEYLRVAIAAPVIGNVYAHHANENVNPLKKLIRTACENVIGREKVRDELGVNTVRFGVV